MNNIKLTDTQIALIIKSALEFNASTIAKVGIIYGLDVKQSYRQKVCKELNTMCVNYGKMLEEILKNE